MNIKQINIKDIKPYENNPRNNKEAIQFVANSIKDFGFQQPLVIDKDGVIIVGHTRLEAAKYLKMEYVPAVIADELTEEQVAAYRLADNSTGEVATWNLDLKKIEINKLPQIDFSRYAINLDFGDNEDGQKETVQDQPPTAEGIKDFCQFGDIWQLGKHRLIVGDSTDPGTIFLLTEGEKINLVYTDPPYGMKKEAEGILNDNLNAENLLDFNKKWIAVAMEQLEKNGSFYIWGIDEPLMDIYAFILRPLIKEGQITFRNLITWNKRRAQGFQSESFRMFPRQDEKCLFFMNGVQGFNTNMENYFEGFEPVRLYLLESREAMQWSVPRMKEIAGHSDKSRDHWTSKSQFALMPEYVYILLQKEAEKERQEKQIENDAFKKTYADLKKEYDIILYGDFENEKQSFYEQRAYFDNLINGSCGNVWDLLTTGDEERKETGGHASPKPIDLCKIGIQASTRKGEKVLDLFGGSGSTLIACEQLERVCYMCELDTKYASVIIRRWEKLTSNTAVKLSL